MHGWCSRSVEVLWRILKKKNKKYIYIFISHEEVYMKLCAISEDLGDWKKKISRREKTKKDKSSQVYQKIGNIQ